MYLVYVGSLWFIWFEFYVYFHYSKGRHQGLQIWTITTQIIRHLYVLNVFKANTISFPETEKTIKYSIL